MQVHFTPSFPTQRATQAMLTAQNVLPQPPADRFTRTTPPTLFGARKKQTAADPTVYRTGEEPAKAFLNRNGLHYFEATDEREPYVQFPKGYFEKQLPNLSLKVVLDTCQAMLDAQKQSNEQDPFTGDAIWFMDKPYASISEDEMYAANDITQVLIDHALKTGRIDLIEPLLDKLTDEEMLEHPLRDMPHVPPTPELLKTLPQILEMWNDREGEMTRDFRYHVPVGDPWDTPEIREIFDTARDQYDPAYWGIAPWFTTRRK